MNSAIGRHVAFFIYPGFNLIDLSGPLDAFGLATEMAPDNYRFTIMSLEGGAIESWSGAKVMSEVAAPDGIDTLVMVGDAGMADREVSPETIDFIRTAAVGAREEGRRPIGVLPRGCKPGIPQCRSRTIVYFSMSAACGPRPA
jgi:transcriptional regulator GlxA family with amidase domain